MAQNRRWYFEKPSYFWPSVMCALSISRIFCPHTHSVDTRTMLAFQRKKVSINTFAAVTKKSQDEKKSYHFSPEVFFFLESF